MLPGLFHLNDTQQTIEQWFLNVLLMKSDRASAPQNTHLEILSSSPQPPPLFQRLFGGADIGTHSGSLRR
jgi:hypothetical protein